MPLPARVKPKQDASETNEDAKKRGPRKGLSENTKLKLDRHMIMSQTLTKKP